MKIRLPPSARRPVLPARRLPPAHPWLQIGLMVMGGLFVLAFMADLLLVSRRPDTAMLFPDVPGEIQALRDGLHGPRYTATNGLFSIVAPRGWTVLQGEDSSPYDVAFRSPNGIMVCLMATPVPYNDLPALYEDIDRRERQYGIRTQIEAIYFQNRPAARRIVKLMKSKALAIDFVADHVAHNLYCEIPTDTFDAYRPALMALLETYRPYPVPAPRAGPGKP